MKKNIEIIVSNVRRISKVLVYLTNLMAIVIFVSPLFGQTGDSGANERPTFENSLAYSYNLLGVADMLKANVDNEAFAPIRTILDDEKLSNAGYVDVLNQMPGSVRVNGVRMGLSSPWIPVMNRSRTIGQWDNHIIADSRSRLRSSSTTYLAQSTKKKGLLKSVIANETITEEEVSDDELSDIQKSFQYDPEDGEVIEEYTAGADFGGMVVNASCLGKYSKNIWFTPVHTTTNFGPSGDTPKYEISRTGFLAGIEKGHCPCTNYGIAFGYTAPVLLQERDRINSDDIVVGLYFRKKFRNDLYINGWIGYGYQEYKQSRIVSVPELDLGYKYEGSYSGHSLTSSTEVYRAIYCKPGFVLRPIVALDIQYADQKGFTEIGRGPFALVYNSINYNSMIARCGIATQIGNSNGESKMVLRQRLYYGRQITGESFPDANASFVNGGTSTGINVRGMDISRDFMMVGAGGQIYLDSTRTCQLFGDYDAIVSTKMTMHTISLGIIQRL
ncbi:MAG: autotransporter outer membrane beta-barrel domain-containing protein [Thermoguttaceae bacterium]